MTDVHIFAKVVADILHPGHIRFFRAARALGTQLTVGVVGDARVSAYKGQPPILSQAERMEVIGACRWVDHVIDDAPKVIDLAFMHSRGLAIYAFGAADDRELVMKLADCSELPDNMRAHLPYTEGISSSLLRQRLRAI